MLRWGLALVAAATAVLFVAAQGRLGAADHALDASGSRLSSEQVTVEIPSVAEITSRLRAQPVVRLDGATARFDEDRVLAAIGDADIRILVTPGGLTSEQRQALVRLDPFDDLDDSDLDPADPRRVQVVVRVVGTSVSGDLADVLADDLAGWQRQFAQDDVTDRLLTLVAHVRDEPLPADDQVVATRAPTTAELSPVIDGLRADGHWFAPDSGVQEIPTSAAAAFPDEAPLIATFPVSTSEPLVDWATAIAEAFPDHPVVTMTGRWLEYRGPDADEFADVAAASFYGEYRRVLGPDVFPAGGVLRVYLARIAELRQSGIFGRPLPAVPFDPLGVALPALPFLFAACAGGFLVLSVVESRRRTTERSGAAHGRSARARMAGLSALLVEVSSLAGSRGSAPIARAAQALQAADDALQSDDRSDTVDDRLDDAAGELTEVADLLQRRDYRPSTFLRGWTA
ncbi:MAG: hypothetical protein INR72_12070 [Williamsia herbipolensis]|nr:hypothetical protein [Williamsia herbipolensis]